MMSDPAAGLSSTLRRVCGYVCESTRQEWNVLKTERLGPGGEGAIPTVGQRDIATRSWTIKLNVLM